MRERLIKLIQEAYDGCVNRSSASIADHLLANGVIVPPCKVGDKLYAISNTRVKETEACEIYINKDNRMSFQIAFDCDEDCDGCPFEAWSQSYCGEWDCGGQYGDSMLVESDFGKTVFLTREEAEQALKEAQE